MTGRTPFRPLVFTVLVAAALALPACRDSGGPLGPGTGSALVTLDTLWPYRDGLGWTYQVVERGLTEGGGFGVYATPAQVPPAPTMREIESRLGHPYAGGVDYTHSSSFTLRFAGSITTMSGVTARNLTEIWARSGVTSARPGGSGFLARLYEVRPDLRARLRARLASVGRLADTIDYHPGVLLHGYAWEKTPEWIGTYGDVDQLLAWKFLTASLYPGSEFTHQLVPSLATDVFLYGRILPRANVATPAGTYRGAVVCAYLVDYGIIAETDVNGAVTGYFRVYDFGWVAYAPRVGPVASYEQRMVSPGGSSAGSRDLSLALTSTDRLPPGLVASGR